VYITHPHQVLRSDMGELYLYPLFLPPMACYRVTIFSTFVIGTGCDVSLYISASLYCVSNVHFIAF